MVNRGKNPGVSIWIAAAAIAAVVAPDAWGQRQEDDGITGRQIVVQMVGSPTSRTLLETAEQYAAQGRAVEAAQAFDDLIEADATMAIEIEPGRYVDAARWLAGRLRRDAELERAYESMVEQRVRAALSDAEREPGEAALRGLAVRYAATPGGLEAALRWAGAALEAADGSTARRVLDRINARIGDDAQRERWLALSAAAALIEGDETAFARRRDELAARRAADRVAELDRWRATWHRPAEPIAEADPEWGAVRAIAKIAEPTWSAPLALASVAGTPRMRSLEDGWARMPNGRVQAQWDPVYELVDGAPAARPTVSRGRVLVNNGQCVTAIDWGSGRASWTYCDDAAVVAAETTRRDINTVGWHIADVRGVAVNVARDGTDGGTVYAALGRLIGDPLGSSVAGADRFGRGRAAPAGAMPRGCSSLVAIDRATGSLRWRVKPADLGEEWIDAAFHGTPIVDGDRLIVLAHHIVGGEFQLTLAAAVDAATGRAIWRRRVALVRERVRGTIESHATMTLAHDRLFVADGLGFIACIDPLTGVADWITRPLAATVGDVNLAQVSVCYERRVDAPVACEAGLVVPMRLRGVGAVVVDPDTGVVWRTLAEGPWADAELVAATGDAMLVISGWAKEAALVDGKTLTARWTAALPKIPLKREPGEQQLDGFNAISRRPPRPPAPLLAGPTLAGDRIVLVVADRLLSLNRATGELTDAGVIGEPGWPLPLTGRLVIVGNRGVRSHDAP